MKHDILSKSYRILLLDEIEEYDEVIQITTVGLDRDPLNAAALNNRGVAYWEIGKVDDALIDFQAAIAAGSDYAPAANRGQIRQGQGDLVGAIEDFSEAIRRDPANATLHRCRGFSQVKDGNDEAALADFAAAIKLDPEFARTYIDRAECLGRLGRTQEAEGDRARAK